MSALDAKFEALRQSYPRSTRRSLVVPLLQLVQSENGFVTEADAVRIAEYVGVPHMQVIEALSWYSMLHSQPLGRHVIKICRNVSCSLRGAERLVEHVQAKLGIAPGETTADGRFTLLTVECLAACGKAPAMQINDTHYDDLDAAAIDRILEPLE